MEFDLGQLVAATVLRFGTFPKDILNILIKRTNDFMTIKLVDGGLEKLDDLVIRNGDVISYNPKYCNCPSDYGIMTSKLEDIAGDYAKSFVSKVPYEEILLQLISLDGTLTFDNYQKYYLNKLQGLGLIKLENDSIKLTERGKLYIFMMDNSVKIAGLRKEVKAFRLRDNLLEDYLMTKEDILNYEFSFLEVLRYREFVFEYEHTKGRR